MGATPIQPQLIALASDAPASGTLVVGDALVWNGTSFDRLPANAANGYAGLDDGGNFVGPVILRREYPADLDAMTGFEGEIATLKGSLDELRMMDGTTPGGNRLLAGAAGRDLVHVPATITLLSTLASGTLTLTAKTSAGQYAVDWWDGTRTLHDTGVAASKTVADNRPKLVRVYAATAGANLTEFTAPTQSIAGIDAGDCAALLKLAISGNPLRRLDLSTLTALQALTVSDNTDLAFLDLSKMAAVASAWGGLQLLNTKLSSVDVRGIPILAGAVSIGGASVKEVLVKDIPTEFAVSGTSMISLDFSQNTAVCSSFAVTGNSQLTTILPGDTSKFIGAFNMYNNDLTGELDLSGASRLQSFDLHGNPNLTSIRVVGMSAAYVGSFPSSVASCGLSAAALNQLFTDLPSAAYASLVVSGNPGAATCDTSIATVKGWTVTL